MGKSMTSVDKQGEEKGEERGGEIQGGRTEPTSEQLQEASKRTSRKDF